MHRCGHPLAVIHIGLSCRLSKRRNLGLGCRVGQAKGSHCSSLSRDFRPSGSTIAGRVVKLACDRSFFSKGVRGVFFTGSCIGRPGVQRASRSAIAKSSGIRNSAAGGCFKCNAKLHCVFFSPLTMGISCRRDMHLPVTHRLLNGKAAVCTGMTLGPRGDGGIGLTLFNA